jgi:uncharacterized protein (DUF2147 family)
MNIPRPIAALLTALCIQVLAPVAPAAATPDPLGYWLVQDGEAVVRIERQGQALTGRIAWLKQPNYPKDDPDGRGGKPKVDAHNPEAKQQAAPLLGLTLLTGFKPGDAPEVWSDGKVYDPKNGKTYSGTLTLVGNDRLDLRGYVLVSLIGRTSTWTRVDGAKYGLR